MLVSHTEHLKIPGPVPVNAITLQLLMLVKQSGHINKPLQWNIRPIYQLQCLARLHFFMAATIAEKMTLAAEQSNGI